MGEVTVKAGPNGLRTAAGGNVTGATMVSVECPDLLQANRKSRLSPGCWLSQCSQYPSTSRKCRRGHVAVAVGPARIDFNLTNKVTFVEFGLPILSQSVGLIDVDLHKIRARRQ